MKSTIAHTTHKVAAAHASKKIIIACLCLGLLSIIWITVSISLRADTATTASFQAEAATKTGNVTQITDATAAGGNAVQFGVVSVIPPEGTTTCPLPKYPTPSCTGVPAGTTLATVNGSVTLSTPGQVYENKKVSGSIQITAANVVIRNVEVTGRVYNSGNNTFTVEDSTIGPVTGCTNIEMMGYGNYTARRVHMRNAGDAFRVSGDNVLIEDSYASLCSVPGDHSDGVQGYFGGTNVIVRHNTIDQRGAQDVTSPIFFADDSESAVVQNNLLAGGGYSLRLHDDFNPDRGPWEATGNRIVQNSYSYGPANNVGTNCATTTWSDNRLVTIDANYNILTLGATVGC
jgi:hypothetical protein